MLKTADNALMRFDTYIPCDILKPYIKVFAISEVLEENSYKVLPDTGVVIGFQFKGKLALIEHNRAVQLASSGLTGIHDSYRTFRNSANIGTLLVYFKEAGAAIFFKQPIHELFRKSVSLDNFMLRSQLLLIEEQLHEAKTDLKRIEIVESFLISRMSPVKHDKLVEAALTLIYKSKGTIRITALMEQLHISQSPLEKRFRQVVGTSPKKFASIVRFKQVLEKYDPQWPLTAVGYEAGYYDQAHFIKEFKNFTGDTPDTFFRKK